MKPTNTLAFLVCMMMTGAAALAVPSVRYDLTQPNPVSNPGVFNVDVTYNDDGTGGGLVSLQLDVAGSSSNLTSAGADFRLFSFAPGAALANWGTLLPVPGPSRDFRVGSSVYAIELDSLSFPLSALTSGTTTIGVLTVNLAGLQGGTSETVALVLPDFNNNIFGTDAGQESPVGDLQSFTFLSLDGVVEVGAPQTVRVPEQQTPAIPEPATLAMGIFGLAVFGVRRSRMHA